MHKTLSNHIHGLKVLNFKERSSKDMISRDVVSVSLVVDSKTVPLYALDPLKVLSRVTTLPAY